MTPSNGACRDKPLPAKGVAAVGHSPAKGGGHCRHSGACSGMPLPAKEVAAVGHSVACRDKPLPAKGVAADGHSDGCRDKPLPVYRKKLSSHTSVDAGSQNGSDVKKSPLRLHRRIVVQLTSSWTVKSKIKCENEVQVHNS